MQTGISRSLTPQQFQPRRALARSHEVESVWGLGAGRQAVAAKLRYRQITSESDPHGLTTRAKTSLFEAPLSFGKLLPRRVLSTY
jgi:hypothetical protein